jgi:hypothetical protein
MLYISGSTQVENEWRDVKGFRVFEYKGPAKETPDGVSSGHFGSNCPLVDGKRLQKTHFGRLREWYCAKQLEPPGGFKPGEQVCRFVQSVIPRI